MALRIVLLVIAVALLAPESAPSFAQDQLLQYSLQVDVDDESRVQFAAAEAELARGDVLTAVSRWRSLLESTRPGSLVPYGGAFLSTSTAVRALLRSQPPAVRNEYLQLTEPVATRALLQALESDRQEALWSLVSHFPFTDAAEEACVQLAERCFDAGEFSDCRLAVDRWLDDLEDPHAGVARRPQMVVWRTVSLLSLGDNSAAETQWSKFSKSIPPDLKQLVAGVETTRLVPLPKSEGVDSAPANVANVANLLPSEERIWSYKLTGGPPASDWISTRSDFEELAHLLLMVNKPRATSQGLILSGITNEAIDWQGRLRWLHRGALTEPAATRKAAVDSLRGVLGESMFGRATIAGDRLFTIEPVQRRDRPVPAYSSRLMASSLATGEALWNVAGFPGPMGGSPAPATILGPPAERYGQLVIAVQSDDQISLVALDAATSKVLWKTHLGASGLSLMADTRRRWMPAVIDMTGESIVCATGNGAVVAVDPHDGSVRWIHRSQREDWRGAGPPPMTVPANMPRFRMWTGWREPVISQIGDHVLWAGPEADALTALDCRTGQVRWTQSRGDGLAVAVEDSVILVITGHEVRRLNPLDGRTIWSTPISAPAGTGFVAGGWYVAPLQSGGTVALKLDNGSATRSVAWNAEVTGEALKPLEQLRSLTWTAKGVLAHSPQSVTLYQTVGELGRSSQDVTGQPQWLAAAGRLAEAERAIPDSDENVARSRSRLRLVAQEQAAEQFHVVATPSERTDSHPADDGVRDHVVEFLLDRRPETAIALFERTAIASLAGVWLESNHRPRLRVRADLLAASTLIARPADSRRAASAITLIDPALQRRLDQLVGHLEAERAGDIPALLSLMASTDWGAARLLAHLETAKPSAQPARDAARRRLSLLRLPALGVDIAPRAMQLATGVPADTRRRAPWPEQEPQPAPVRPWNSIIGQWPIPFEVRPESELAGLALDFKLQGSSLKKQGMGVHFAGAGQDRPWSLDLPKSNRSLAQSADYRHATAVGPLVVLQAGTGLFGLLPFDESGQRQATNLWDVPWIDMWGDVATHSVGFLPRLSDVAPGRHPLDLDDFGRPLAQVGPVTAASFCYREFDRLVACDTATGRRLWDRRPFEPEAFAVGDETQLILLSPRQNRIELLDPLDGRLLASRSMVFPARHWRTAIGSTSILRSGLADSPVATDTEPSGLAAVDLTTGHVRWKQSIADGSVDFMVSDRLVGAVEPKAIRLFDPVTGQERSSVPITPPNDITDVYAVDDPFSLMICVFGPPAVEQLRPPLMLVGNRRRPYANGTVYGLDPQTLELKWTIPLDRSVFPLDQPRDIPLLFINDAVIVIDENGLELRDDRIRVFDKRTGRQVGKDIRGAYVGSYGMAIERSQADGWVQVRTSKGIFRFDFNPSTAQQP